MVYRHINTDLKHRILLLIERGRTSEELCDLFAISLRSLDRWLTNFEQYIRKLASRRLASLVELVKFGWWNEGWESYDIHG